MRDSFPEADVSVCSREHDRDDLADLGLCPNLFDFDEVLADIIRRDKYDSSRAASPLKPAEDAVHIDSTAFTMDEVVEQICNLARKAM